MTPGDERYAQSMADLSSRMRARMAGRPPTDPITALKNRQAALKALDRERQQQYLLVLGGVTCVLAAGILAWGIVRFAAPDAAMNTTVASATPAPASAPMPVEASTPAEPVIVAQKEAPAPASPVVPDAAPPPAVTMAEIAPPRLETSTPASPPQQSPAPPSMARSDIAEAQRLLWSLGYSPGPIDGSAGRLTQDAIRRYQEDRGLAQTGALDDGTLTALRQDPAPKRNIVATRPQPLYPPPSASSNQQPQYAQAQPQQRRTPSIFTPVERAGQGITDFFNRVLR